MTHAKAPSIAIREGAVSGRWGAQAVRRGSASHRTRGNRHPPVGRCQPLGSGRSTAKQIAPGRCHLPELPSPGKLPSRVLPGAGRRRRRRRERRRREPGCERKAGPARDGSERVRRRISGDEGSERPALRPPTTELHGGEGGDPGSASSRGDRKDLPALSLSAVPLLRAGASSPRWPVPRIRDYPATVIPAEPEIKPDASPPPARGSQSPLRRGTGGALGSGWSPASTDPCPAPPAPLRRGHSRPLGVGCPAGHQCPGSAALPGTGTSPGTSPKQPQCTAQGHRTRYLCPSRHGHCTGHLYPARYRHPTGHSYLQQLRLLPEASGCFQRSRAEAVSLIYLEG